MKYLGPLILLLLIAVALALAFGLGGREAAARLASRWVDHLCREQDAPDFPQTQPADERKPPQP